MKKLLLSLIILTAINVYSQWKPTLGAYGGQAHVIKQINNRLFACKNSIYYYNNSDENWIQTNFAFNKSIMDINYFKGKYYAATREGLYYSNNHDLDWQIIDDEIFVDDYYSTITTNDTVLFIASNNHLYKTIDGKNWEIINFNEKDNGPHKIKVKNGITIVQYFSSVYLSNNYGVNWEEITPGGYFPADPIGIIIKDKSIYLILFDGRFYKSNDFGKSWNLSNIPVNNIISFNSYKDTICIGNESGNFLISDNNGETWKNRIVEQNFNRITSIEYYNNRIFIATSLGIYYSDDLGLSWVENINGYTETVFNDFAISDNELLAATYSNGIFELEATNKEWIKKYDTNEVLKIAAKDNVLVLLQYPKGLLITEDYGKNWISPDKSNGFSNKAPKSAIVYNDKVLVSAPEGFYLSDNLGKQWEKLDTEFTNLQPKDTFMLRSSFINFELYDSILYAGTNQHKGLYKCNINNITKWEKIKTGITEIDSALAINNITVKDSIILLSCYDNFYISKDYGNTWKKEFENIENITFYNSKIYENLYFLGTSTGVYVSDDLINWIEINEGLKNWDIISLEILDNNIYVGTTSGGYYRNIDEIILSSVEEPESRNYLYTYPPYPQPASTEVLSLVYWDTSLEMNKESVRIYSTNGVEVGREQDISFEQINAYSGNLIWNCTNVPDGVYLIQISHGDKKRTIKVMVRK